MAMADRTPGSRPEPTLPEFRRAGDHNKGGKRERTPRDSVCGLTCGDDALLGRKSVAVVGWHGCWGWGPASGFQLDRAGRIASPERGCASEPPARWCCTRQRGETDARGASFPSEREIRTAAGARADWAPAAA
jgi:hypothetical protein